MGSMTTAGHEGPGPELASLIDAAAKGDQAAWRDLIGLYWRRVYALARSRCGRDELAEEVTQSVFVTVAERLTGEGYREQGRFESWLFRIAVNRLRDEARRQRRQAEPIDPEQLTEVRDRGASPPDAAREADLAALRQALARLNDADRDIIELRHHAGLSFKQMADLLDEPVGTLLARHHRALQKLRDLMHASPPPESAARIRGDTP